MPGDLTTTGVIALYDSLQYVTGSGGNILTGQNLPHVASMAMDGSFSWQMIYEQMIHYGYTYEMWLESIAREQGDQISSGNSFFSTTNFNFSATNIRALFIDFSAAPKAGYRVGTSVVSYDIGYAQWQYGTQFGPLQPIHFLHQKLVPEYANPTGCTLWFREPMSGEYTYYNRSSSTPWVSTGGMRKIKPSADDLDGQGWGASIDRLVMVSEVDSINVPTVSSGNIVTTNTMTAPWGEGLISTIGTGPTASLPMAYLAEAWQQVVQRERGTGSSSQSLVPGDQDILASAGFASKFDAGITVTGPNKSTQWRFPGLPSYGYWAPKYGDYHGTLQNINSAAPRMVPDAIGCTGVWVYLKGGLSGVITITEKSVRAAGIETPNGVIRLEAGVVDGVPWAL